MLILSLETSCDDTAASLARADENGIGIISNVVSSQIKLHSEWGGVVPNLAAREHLKNVLPVIEECLKKAGVKPADLDLLAVTNGPGLIPALLIGTSTTKTLSYLWKKPLIGIHHIEGHIYANFIGDKIGVISNFQFPISKQIQNFKLQTNSYNLEPKAYFPILCLVVSGGHTQLVLMRNHLEYEIIGETMDDAVGEAFDKVARILGLGYPGGPAIAKMASLWKSQFTNPNIRINSKSEKQKSNIENLKLEIRNYGFTLPRPMLNSDNFNFSFSGLKTAVLYLVKKNEQYIKDENFIAEVCHEFQQAAVDVLVQKTIRAAKAYAPKTIMIAGGVSANVELRNQLGEAVAKNLPDTEYVIPDTKYSIDNAAMIAAAAYYRFEHEKNKNQFMDTWKNLQTDANLKLTKC